MGSPPGVASAQQLLPFPACNLVVDPDGAAFAGPATRRSERVLAGRGWAVGALLRPAAALPIAETLGLGAIPALRDAERPVDAPGLHAAVVAAMTEARPGAERRARAAEAVARWILAVVPVPSPGGDAALANALAEVLADPAVTRVDQLERRLHVSTRSLQRLAERWFGIPLHAMIRRRRLQEAAERLRGDPELGISRLASELGYAGHAHFTTDFKAVMGVTPSAYRASVPGPSRAAPTSRAEPTDRTEPRSRAAG
ncbi:helix-turn-helix domain-containing protein [Leucobacter allii]|uniref:Helix-turn-helix domain-containing protein n=1 Tax=Leucobacter allii TaxID=2932247 RepID=A0ABY4FIY2_9MICO|nr:helix-turn-helix domain-containing protein [Leucobacter allii]UOQ56647.1 helix-turn-helix domain-containing protein [Leucobacter allii]